MGEGGEDPKGKGKGKWNPKVKRKGSGEHSGKEFLGITGEGERILRGG